MRERMTEHRGGDEAHDALCSSFSPGARRGAAAIKQIGRHARRKESIRQRPPRPPRPPRAAAAAAACGKPCTLLTTIKNSGRYSGSGGKQEKGTRLLMNLSNALSSWYRSEYSYYKLAVSLHTHQMCTIVHTILLSSLFPVQKQLVWYLSKREQASRIGFVGVSQRRGRIF